MSSLLGDKQNPGGVRWTLIRVSFIGVLVVVVLFPMPWNMLVVGALFAIFPAYWIANKPTRAVYLLAVYIPFEEFIEKWLPDGPVYESARFGGEILLLVGLVFVLINKVFIQGQWHPTPVDVPFFCFVIISFASAIINQVPFFPTLLGLRPIIRYILAFYILAEMRVDNQLINKLLKAIIITAILVSFIALLQSIIGMPLTAILVPKDVIVGDTFVRAGLRQNLAERTKVFATLGRYDTLGTFLTVTLLLSFGMYFNADKEWKRLIKIFWWFAVPALALSYSRQSWLALYFGLVTVSFLFWRKKLVTFMLILLPVLLLLLVVLFPQYVEYSSNKVDVSFFNRLLEPFSEKYYEISRYSYGRLYVITEVSQQILQKKPFLGFGPARFGSLTTNYLGFDYSKLINIDKDAARLVNDVNWVTVLGQVGIIGTSLFFIMLISVVSYAYRLSFRNTTPLIKGLSRGYIGCVIAFLILGFFGPNLEVRQVSFYIWLIGGLLAGSRSPSIYPEGGLIDIRSAS